MFIIESTNFNKLFALNLKSINRQFATKMPDAIANLAGDSLRAY